MELFVKEVKNVMLSGIIMLYEKYAPHIKKTELIRNKIKIDRLTFCSIAGEINLQT